MKRTLLTALTLGFSLATFGVAAAAPIPYSTEQVISNGDSDAVIAEKAAKVLPRANQTDWMRLERTFFLHFGVNTFQRRRVGHGPRRTFDFQSHGAGREPMARRDDRISAAR